MKREPEVSQAPEATDEIDPQALAAIRDLLRSEKDAPAETKTARAETDAPVPQKVSDTQTEVRARQAENLPPLSQAPEPATASARRSGQIGQKAGRAEGPLGRLKSRITGYRPKPKHIVIAGAALVVLFRPWLVVGLVLLGLFLLIGVFLAVGYDGFWKRAMAIGHWYARRHPSRAEELHRKLDDFALKWDAFLDRFPEGSVDGLYLPDFGELATAEARHDAAMKRRLSAMQDNNA